tara:strand:+ start:116830 stop:117651 length:822 start_codon:yes stop_codon:yes gene_type:complete
MLGADFCAEHEFGIKRLREMLGIIDRDKADRTKVFGADRYKVNAVDPKLFWFKELKSRHDAVLICSSHIGSDWHAEQRAKLEKGSFDKFCQNFEIDIHKPFREDDEPQVLATAWDEGSFGIHAKGKEGVEYLRRLYQAFLDNDVVVYLGAPPLPAFSNSSLNLMIASQIPQEGLDQMETCDREAWELKRDAEKTGIEERLRKAGCRFYALSPRRGLLESRVSHGKIPPSKHDIMFWLNPMEQNRYDHGWFTVEELDLWIKGEGPVIKKKEAAS